MVASNPLFLLFGSELQLLCLQAIVIEPKFPGDTDDDTGKSADKKEYHTIELPTQLTPEILNVGLDVFQILIKLIELGSENCDLLRRQQDTQRVVFELTETVPRHIGRTGSRSGCPGVGRTIMIVVEIGLLVALLTGHIVS